MTQDKLLAELRAMAQRAGARGKAKTRREWEVEWGTSTPTTMRFITAGVKAGLMRYQKIPMVQINGVTKATDAYEIVDDKPKGRKPSTRNR